MINSIMILDFWFKECTPKMWFKKDKEFDNLITLNKSVEEVNLSLLIEEMFYKIQKFDKDKFIDNYTAKSIINKLDVI